MYAELQGAIQSAQVLHDLLKASRKLENFNEISAAVAEVNMKLMEATSVALQSQEKHAELLKRVSELEREVANLREAENKLSGYKLFKFETGTLAYAPLSSEDPATLHFLCAKCFDEGRHSKLQPLNAYYLKCHACNTQIQSKPVPPPQPRRQIGPSFPRDW